MATATYPIENQARNIATRITLESIEKEEGSRVSAFCGSVSVDGRIIVPRKTEEFHTPYEPVRQALKELDGIHFSRLTDRKKYKIRVTSKPEGYLHIQTRPI